MNLRSATSTTQDVVEDVFHDAIHNARSIIDRASQSRTGDAPSWAALRNRILEQLANAINCIGEDDFQKLDVREMLGEDFDARADWPIFVIAAALEHCDASAKRGDGGAQSGMDSIADGLKRLDAVINKLSVMKTGRMEWTEAFATEIHSAVAAMNLCGAWNAQMTPEGTLTIAPVYLPQALIVAEHAITFQVIEKTFVLTSEAGTFRLNRARLLGEKIKIALDEAAALQRRQQEVLGG